MNEPRLIFPYVQLTDQSGLPVLILCEEIVKMTVRKAIVNKETPDAKEIMMTELANPYGMTTNVFENPEQIIKRMASTTNKSIMDFQNSMASGVLVAPAGTVLK